MASEITRADFTKTKVAIIPTGSFFRGQLQNIKDVEWYIPTESGKMIPIDPKTTDYSSLTKISFGYGAINSPEILAEMLYNAIFIDKMDYIYITGGRDNEFVIIKLNELIEKNKTKDIFYGFNYDKMLEMNCKYILSGHKINDETGPISLLQHFTSEQGSSDIWLYRVNGSM